jgi:hypothetical protein
MTITEFVTSLGATMTVKPIDSNPNMPDADVAMSHYACLIRVGKSRLTVPFSMGSGLSGEPQIGDVLDCMASDASTIENARSFEAWCAELGYDEDSRKAERTFKICQRQAVKLKRLLSQSAYDTLLWNTERA